MNKQRIAKWMAGLAMAGVLGWLVSGCAWSIGSDRKADARPTKGQELVDLKKAHDQGAITDQEYQAQKDRLLGK